MLLLRYFEKPFARIYVIKFQIFWPITLYCNSMKLGLCHIYHIKPSNFWNRKLHVLQGLWKLINCLYVYTFYVVYPNQNLNTLSQKTVANNQHKIDVFVHLTEVAGEGGIDWAPQKILSSQQFRHLMRCTKHVNKICLPCLVPEISLFKNVFVVLQYYHYYCRYRRNSKWSHRNSWSCSNRAFNAGPHWFLIA